MILTTGKHAAASRPVDTARHSGGPAIPAAGGGGPSRDARMKVGPDAGGSIPEEIAGAGDEPEGALWGGGKHRLPHRGDPGPRGSAHE